MMGAGIRSHIRSLFFAVTVAFRIGCHTPAQAREECAKTVAAWPPLQPCLRECRTCECLPAGFTSEFIHVRMSLHG